MFGRYYVKSNSDLCMGTELYVEKVDALTHNEIDWTCHVRPETLRFRDKSEAIRVTKELASNEFPVRLVFRYWMFGWKEKEVAA